MRMLRQCSGQQFVQEATAFLAEHIASSVAARGRAVLGLSGGRTPAPVYEALGNAPIDWTNVHVFLLDERYVPPDHAESNQRLVRGSLLRHAALPEANMHVPDTRLVIDECVRSYEDALEELFQDSPPDVLVLGMGEDGHIASLFPPLTDAVLADASLVLRTMAPSVFAIRDRISLAMQPILAARSHLVLLRGNGKRQAFDTMMESGQDATRWPLRNVLETSRDSAVLWAEE